MKNLTWQNPEQLFVAQELINKVKSKCCGIKDNVKNEEYYLIGDAQTVIEGPIQREQIFAIIIKVKRKGKWIVPEDFQWKFFAHIWPNIIPLRRTIIKTYRFFKR